MYLMAVAGEVMSWCCLKLNLEHGGVQSRSRREEELDRGMLVFEEVDAGEADEEGRVRFPSGRWGGESWGLWFGVCCGGRG